MVLLCPGSPWSYPPAMCNSHTSYSCHFSGMDQQELHVYTSRITVTLQTAELFWKHQEAKSTEALHSNMCCSKKGIHETAVILANLNQVSKFFHSLDYPVNLHYCKNSIITRTIYTIVKVKDHIIQPASFPKVTYETRVQREGQLIALAQL